MISFSDLTLCSIPFFHQKDHGNKVTGILEGEYINGDLRGGNESIPSRIVVADTRRHHYCFKLNFVA